MENPFRALTGTRKILVISLFILALLMTGLGISCYSPEPAPPATSPGLPTETTPGTPAAPEVILEGFAFKPAEISVPAGSTVTWSNHDSVPHTITARDKTFDSGSLASGNTFSYTFDEKGTFEYYCAIHSYMEGKVVVE